MQREVDNAIGNRLSTLKGSVVTFREELNLLPLETAITLLQRALENEKNTKESRSILHHHLKRALLTRYGYIGCIQDLEACLFGEGATIVVAKGRTGREIEQVEEVQRAIRLIDECRQSVDTTTLNNIIQIAEESIQLHSKGDRVLQQAELHILLGNALVMKYFNSPGKPELLHAANRFRKAEYLCGDNLPLAYISIVALSHIGGIWATEHGDCRGVFDLAFYYGKASSLDEKGAKLFRIGSKMVEGAIEYSEFQKLQGAVDCLASSLSCRVHPHPQRPSTLKSLSSALRARFDWRGDIKDLEDGILLNREALRLESRCHPDRSLSLNNLANTLSVRFQQKGLFQDLEESIVLHREILHSSPHPHPFRSTSLNNLANALSIRFKQNGALRDLEECILLHQEALELRRLPHPDRSSSLINLANALSIRFEWKGAFQDLAECILLHREALDLAPPPHLDRSLPVNSLASSLLIRFKQKGAYQDLEESIALNRRALHLRPPPHPLRFTSLNNLAVTLLTRFERKGLLQDVDECILLHREALNLKLPPSPDRPPSLNNLASALQARYKQKGALQDLEESILLHRESLDLRPTPHPLRFISLSSLAFTLLTHFKQQGSFKDLEESILLHQEALDVLPPSHPGRCKILGHLADSHLDRFDINKESTDLEQALRYFESGSQDKRGSLLIRLGIINSWALCARTYRQAAALNAYLGMLEALPLLASMDLTLKERSDVLEHTRGIVGDAAQCAISQSRFETAVVFLSTGRSTFWSQAYQLRTPVDEVAAIDPTLAEEYKNISSMLEQAAHNQERRSHMKLACDASASQQTVFHNLSTLASQQCQVVEKIRRVPGLERFLLPPSFPALQLAGRAGPVIFLNASRFGCDALIMRGESPVEHVNLSNVDVGGLNALRLLNCVALKGELRAPETIQPDIRNAIIVLQELLLRDVYQDSGTDSIASEDILQCVLEVLWERVVHPVIKVLALPKRDSPTRIWWCPSGEFASLPIHAAGIYSPDQEPIDALFQYAVSSYITSPQDLLHPLSPICPDFKMTAIIEPEAPGGELLPAARDELQRIKSHIPNPNQLVTHIGAEDRQNHVEDVISDLQQSSIVHFGCHGTQNLDNPLDSYLLLSGGRLTMSRIIKECRVSNTAALAYLSACETAKGDKDRPDESLNLVATMMFARFRSVVGTMWSIFDRDAPIVADAFYGHLFRHGKDAPPDIRDAAYSLHLATKKLREEGRGFQSWVPYVHYGV